MNYLYRIGTAPRAEAGTGLVWRTLQEVGEVAYVEAIRTVMQGTLDRTDAESCRRLGPEQSATHFFANLSDGMQYEPRLWKLGYTATGTLMGLIAPLYFRVSRPARKQRKRNPT